MVPPDALDGEHLDVHLVSRSEFVDEDVLLRGSRVGQPRGLVTTWLPHQVLARGHVAVVVLSRLTTLTTLNLQ